MQHADIQAVTYLHPECMCRSGEEGRGGLARSTELAKGGRPGSRLAVTLNLDLVSIGVLGPVFTEKLLKLHRDVAFFTRLRPGATRIKLATDLIGHAHSPSIQDCDRYTDTFIFRMLCPDFSYFHNDNI